MAVVAKETLRVAGGRRGTMIRAGAVYSDDDPIVQARPELFESPEDHQRRKSRPQSTADLGHRSMSARRVETARAAPGELRDVDYPCTQCTFRGTSERALKTHVTKAHG